MRDKEAHKIETREGKGGTRHIPHAILLTIKDVVKGGGEAERLLWEKRTAR